MPTQTSRGKLYNQLRLMQDSARPGSVGALGGVLGMDEALPQQPRRNTLADALAVGSMLPGAGDALGVAADAHMYATDPSSRKLSNYLLSGAGALLPGIGGATVYHSSPFKFDAFDSSKIGTGEGVQAYGHGIYQADIPEETFPFAAPRAAIDVVGIARGHGLDISRAAGIALASQARRSTPLNVASQGAQNANIELRGISANNLENAIQEYRNIKKGHFYTSDLPDEHINNMLSWDDVLSDQTPAIQELAKRYATPAKKGEDVFGRTILKHLESRMGGPRGAAEFLRNNNIPGVRYLDSRSRYGRSGPSSSNYVVFDDKLLKILKRE